MVFGKIIDYQQEKKKSEIVKLNSKKLKKKVKIKIYFIKKKAVVEIEEEQPEYSARCSSRETATTDGSREIREGEAEKSESTAEKTRRIIILKFNPIVIL